MNNRALFLQHVAQTSDAPMGLEMVSAKGIYQYDVDGKAYVDLISGFSVCNIGHGHPQVLAAIEKQITAYMHLIVYGEFIQTPQVRYAKKLTDLLPDSLNCVYFTNSGAEAVEGAMKLAKRVTGRSKMICFDNSYHGSTQGALSLIGDEYFRQSFRPLLPGIYHHRFNDPVALEAIDEDTACVIMETVQAEAGIIRPDPDWITAIREKCTRTGTLLIFDEIQAGFGRTGHLFAFEKYGTVPDILLLAKALGGGMPLGAFIADKKLMRQLTYNPVLGHITTFGGHPVSCAAGLAALEVLLEGDYIAGVAAKEKVLKSKLRHPAIKKLRTAGLWACLEFADFETNKKVIDQCIQAGLIADWFLFNPAGLRIGPPLIITEKQLEEVCDKILLSIEKAGV
ncbi:Acetylornithine/succinyldiaminopimelate/putrescine aminotransferase [Arachidicoccus rhizosphaerae]|uniref:Acetylornithine/succinyldiaminopimelate/putrescine aminotransferase n=1 Tax=Arachidicoccus rhizosphaerae TaxID=551991 RepID=A0A1H3ZJG8_9BACT|nr:aspartate aminotransferase family protein [Arachidicoccus rhizosphaerae]SEA23873.1 Acetylornithine/succinyldiaminopimelate/putrescine aminotransferase [Arachidicoccus rhizosphaerae]